MLYHCIVVISLEIWCLKIVPPAMKQSLSKVLPCFAPYLVTSCDFNSGKYVVHCMLEGEGVEMICRGAQGARKVAHPMQA